MAKTTPGSYSTAGMKTSKKTGRVPDEAKGMKKGGGKTGGVPDMVGKRKKMR